MLRKGIPDIRYLRSSEPRIRAQMDDLEPWREVSLLPPISRDLSVVIDARATDEEANGLRNRVYLAIHEGPHVELA